MRFIRNHTLKTHLDRHFEKNIESKRRGNRAISRPNFLNTLEFSGKGKMFFINHLGSQNATGQKNVEELVKYTNKQVFIHLIRLDSMFYLQRNV